MKRGDRVLVSRDEGFTAIGTIERLHRDGTATAKVEMLFPVGEEGYVTLYLDGTCKASEWYKPAAHYEWWAPALESDTAEGCREKNRAIQIRLREEARESEREIVRRSLQETKELTAVFQGTWREWEVGEGDLKLRYITGSCTKEGPDIGIIVRRVRVTEPQETYAGMYEAYLEITVVRKRGGGSSFSQAYGEDPEDAIRNAILACVRQEI